MSGTVSVTLKSSELPVVSFRKLSKVEPLAEKSNPCAASKNWSTASFGPG